jgi:hypothetical protein
MTFDPNRTTFSPEVLTLAKELDEMIEAIALGTGDKLQEVAGALMSIYGTYSSSDDFKVDFFKAGMALMLDNIQEHLLEGEVE